MTSRLTRLQRGLAAASVLALGTLALTSSASATTGDTEELVPSEAITVDVLTANGSGCPSGTAAVRPQPDRTGFSVSYSAFAAQAGAGADATDVRKNCQLSLLVHVPQGFSYAVSRADYYGFANLAKGATGLHRTNYYFMGSTDNEYRSHTFSGPLLSRWHTVDTDDALVYSPCSASKVLNVNTELRVDDGTSSASSTSALAMAASSGDVNTLFHFSWKRC